MKEDIKSLHCHRSWWPQQWTKAFKPCAVKINITQGNWRRVYRKKSITHLYLFFSSVSSVGSDVTRLTSSSMFSGLVRLGMGWRDKHLLASNGSFIKITQVHEGGSMVIQLTMMTHTKKKKKNKAAWGTTLEQTILHQAKFLTYAANMNNVKFKGSLIHRNSPIDHNFYMC